MSRPSDDEIREEQEFHLASRAELNQAAGMAAGPARDQARRAFGSEAAAFESTRAVHVSRWLDAARQDLLYAVRGFVRGPGLPLAALAVLALGVGSATAVFSVVDRILFRSLPYPGAESLVSFGLAAPVEPNEFMLGPDYSVWRREQTPFAAVASWSGSNDCDLTEGEAQRLRCASVEAAMLPMLGVRPFLGRNFTSEEDRPGVPRTAILSHALWRSRFNGARSIVGRAISLDGQSVRVAGVLPPGFELPTLNAFDILVTQQLRGSLDSRGNMEVLRTFARLKPGVSVAQAGTALAPLFEAALKSVPAAFRKEVRLRIRPLRDRQAGEMKAASWVLLGAVGMVLLIACANLANLLLARGAARQREMTVRASLGASRLRLVRQLLTECLLLAAAGGIAGTGLAWAMLRTLIAAAPPGIPRLADASLDLRVLLFALVLSLVAGLLAGAAPALQLPRAAALAGGRSIAGGGGGAASARLRYCLVTAQIAASLVLLTGAALLLRSLWKMQAVPLGISAENVIAVPLTLGRASHAEPAQRAAFFDQLEQKVAAMPGATAIALADTVPPSGPVMAMIYSLIDVEGRPPIPEGTGGMIPWRTVTPGFFSVLNAPILRGRGFNEEDRRPGQDSVIVGQELARRLFGRSEALGKRLRFGRSGGWHTVVGIAAPVRNSGYGPHAPEYYLPRKRPHGAIHPDSREGARRATLLIRSQWSVAAAEVWIRKEIAALDPALPVVAEPLTRRVAELAERPRFNALLFTLFAITGLVLAAIGLYGVIAFLVTQRTREIGVRLAIGATPGSVTLMVVRQALQWSAAGLALGLLVSWFASRLLQTMLFDMPARDPATWTLAALALAFTATAAAWIPARRAGRVNPVAALRADG